MDAGSGGSKIAPTLRVRSLPPLPLPRTKGASDRIRFDQHILKIGTRKTIRRKE